jgi:hypothetical protein
MQVIKWFNTPYWEQNIILDNTPYILSANFNIRDNNWYINLLTNDNIALITGKKLILGIDILNNVYNESRPEGYLLVVPINDVVEEVTRDNMGIEIELIYINRNEIL